MAKKLIIFLIIAFSVRLLGYAEAKPVDSNSNLYQAEHHTDREDYDLASKTNSSVRTKRQFLPLNWLRSDDEDGTIGDDDTDEESLAVAEQRSQFADQIMREADAIRAIIRDTIDATIDAGDLRQVGSPRKSQSRKQSRKSSKSSSSSSDQSGGFIPNLLALFPTVTPQSPAPTDTAFMDRFRILWSDFLENSKEMWTALPPAENAEENEVLQQFQRLWLQFLGTARKMLD